MNEPSSSSPLRRADQSFVAVLVFIALVAMAAYWIVAGGHRGDLVDVDRAEPLSASFRVDINTASWPELAQLPGVGETLARRIVESRECEGPFHKYDDIERVHGVGPILLKRIQPFLSPIGHEG